ncbi:hypothetical protein ACOSQ4_014850 [Xanthoceras sorbifolium]
MGACKEFKVIFIWTILISLSFSLETTMGMRPLLIERDHQLQKKSGDLIIQSLQRGPVPPVGGSPCTFIPNRGRGRCTLEQINFAEADHHHHHHHDRDRVAHALPVFPVFPDFIVRFGVASSVS